MRDPGNEAAYLLFNQVSNVSNIVPFFVLLFNSNVVYKALPNKREVAAYKGNYYSKRFLNCLAYSVDIEG